MTQPTGDHTRPNTVSRASVKFQKKLLRDLFAEGSGQDFSQKWMDLKRLKVMWRGESTIER
jgi:hypothetical protein